MVSELPGQLEEEMVCFKDPSEKAQRGTMKDDITTQPRLTQKGSSSSSLLPLKGHCVCHEVNLLSPLKACESGRRSALLLLIRNAEWFLLPPIANCFSCLSEQKTRPCNPSSFVFVLNIKHFCKLMCCHVSVLVLSPKWSTFEEFIAA